MFARVNKLQPQKNDLFLQQEKPTAFKLENEFGKRR